MKHGHRNESQDQVSRERDRSMRISHAENLITRQALLQQHLADDIVRRHGSSALENGEEEVNGSERRGEED